MITNLLDKRTILFLCAGLILGLFFSSSLFFLYLDWVDRQLTGKIYPSVYVDNLPVGKLTKEKAITKINNRYDNLRNILFTVKYKNETIATFSAQTLDIKPNTEEIVEKAYNIARVSELGLMIYQRTVAILGLQSFQFSTKLSYNPFFIDDFLDRQEEMYNRAPKNALFEFVGGRVVSFKPDEKGLKINSEEFRNKLELEIEKLKNHPTNKTLHLTATILEPTITLAKINDFGIEEEIGRGQSDYTHSIQSRVHNIILATSKFHGVLIPKGALFSFNETIGDISAQTGYEPAYIIKNGRTVLGDGGGVCQVSTTLFRTAINTGLPIIERHAHAYRVSYYENDAKPGLDATVFSPGVDLKFQNDTPVAILIQSEIDQNNNILRFIFYGKKDNRKVEISEPVLWDVIAPPPPIYQDDPTLPRGVTRQIDYPAWGGKAKFDYKVTYPDGRIIQKEFFSSFRPWRAIFLVGTAG